MPFGNSHVQMGQTQVVIQTNQSILPPTTSVNRKLTKKRSIILGSLQIVSAFSAIIIAFVCLDNYIQHNNSITPSYQTYRHIEWSLRTILDSNIWFGIIFGLSGIFTILAGTRPFHCNVVTVIIVSIISSVTSMGLIIHSRIWYVKDNAIFTSLMLTSLLQGAVSFSCLVIASNDACCSCCKPSEGRVYYTPNPTHGPQFVSPQTITNQQNQLPTTAIGSIGQPQGLLNYTAYPTYPADEQAQYKGTNYAPPPPPPYQIQ